MLSNKEQDKFLKKVKNKKQVRSFLDFCRARYLEKEMEDPRKKLVRSLVD